MNLFDAEVMANIEAAPRHREIVLKAPETLSARPGQFIHILCGEPPAGDGCNRFLRRPFSLFRVEPAAGTVHVLYRVLGEGTRWLGGRRPGERLSVLGPLGNPFPMHDGAAVLVGGGVGIPPLYFLARALAARGTDVRVLLGARTGDDLLAVGDFHRAGIPLAVATDDGSAGHHGLVTDLLDGALTGTGASASPVVIHACGPLPMLRAVQEQAAVRGLPAYLSLEERMACGVGACLGCPVAVPGNEPYPPGAVPPAGLPGREEIATGYRRVAQATAGEAGVVYRRVCLEGPVFPAWEVVLAGPGPVRAGKGWA